MIRRTNINGSMFEEVFYFIGDGDYPMGLFDGVGRDF